LEYKQLTVQTHSTSFPVPFRPSTLLRFVLLEESGLDLVLYAYALFTLYYAAATSVVTYPPLPLGVFSNV